MRAEQANPVSFLLSVLATVVDLRLRAVERDAAVIVNLGHKVQKTQDALLAETEPAFSREEERGWQLFETLEGMQEGLCWAMLE